MALLEVRDVTVSFGGVAANTDVSLDVEAGQIVGLIGPNGAGKTTLFNAISGFVAPKAGRVCLDGEDLLCLLPYERATRGIGRTFQGVRLFPSLTVEDNLIAAYHSRMRGGVLSGILRLPRARASEGRARRRLAEVLSLVDLQPYLRTAAGELSYGTLRLTELGCLMMFSPRVILLDEPASGIAQSETQALAELLRRLRNVIGATILMIEHDMPLVMGVSDVIYCLDLGRVIARGTPEQVREDVRVVDAYLGPRPGHGVASARAPRRVVDHVHVRHSAQKVRDRG